ncbi:MAG: transcriptional regulator [Acidobacteria bacterium]|nr:transcriptional regulator [Acidobacteriota bacterium]
MPRYRFGDFVLSPRRRVLVRGTSEAPLIPRYFDLLVFLVEHRHEAVHRRDIFDRVWSDVVVSDSALSQAIRTIRRTLGDDSREPRFIRTVARHGYRFVFDGVIEEDEESTWPAAAGAAAPAPAVVVEIEPAGADDPFEPLLQRLSAGAGETDHEDRREAAELLHHLGTREALSRLGTRPGHVLARAMLRDARWDVPSAGEVPIAGTAESWRTAAALVRLRLRRAARIAASRGVAASIGGFVAGGLAGLAGGTLLALLPDSTSPPALAGVLAAIGSACGACGGAGVGAGISMAEAAVRSRRAAALLAGAAIGGGLVGGLTQWLGRWSLSTLVGVEVPIGGALEGLALGAAAGLGYAAGTPRADGGLAAPRGRRRAKAVAVIAAACSLTACALTFMGRPLVGGTIHQIAKTSNGSRAALTSLGRLVGEPDFGPVSGTLLGMAEGGLFGAGVAIGLTRRRRA